MSNLHRPRPQRGAQRQYENQTTCQWKGCRLPTGNMNLNFCDRHARINAKRIGRRMEPA